LHPHGIPELHSATVVLEQNLSGTITSSQLRSVIQDIYSGLLEFKDGSIKKVEVFVWKQDGNNPDVWHPVWHVIAKGKKSEWDENRESFLDVVWIILKEINGPWESSREDNDVEAPLGSSGEDKDIEAGNDFEPDKVEPSL
jgi:hypothetical protein